jgi:hypothetical protein
MKESHFAVVNVIKLNKFIKQIILLIDFSEITNSGELAGHDFLI